MTLIAAVRCADAVILGSDSRQTRGATGRRLARPAQKVYEPRKGVLLAAAGAQDVAQEFALRMQRARGVSPNADRLAMKSRLQQILAELRKDSTIEERSDYVEFLIAWRPHKARKPVALHVFSGRAAEWVDGWAFGGAKLAAEIADFAVSTMRYVKPAELTLDQAKVVVLKVLRDTIEACGESVGGAVQLGVVERRGVLLVEQADMRVLHDAVDLWETRSAALLLGAAPPSASDTPDRGVRPPM
jgi:20S proteasome alpha/beta subunit